MRWTTLVLWIAIIAGCNDIRDYRGTWSGERIGQGEPLRVGDGGAGTLAIDRVDTRGIAGTITVAGLVENQPFESIAGAEADTLANMSFSGNPLRVFLAFVPLPDGGGDALAVIAVFDDRRVELRLLRGGSKPLYAIFAMQESA